MMRQVSSPVRWGAGRKGRQDLARSLPGFKVLGVLFLGEVYPAFLLSKKACWSHQFRYLGVGQQYPGVFRDDKTSREGQRACPEGSRIGRASLPTLDRILCVVRELTDDSRRGAGSTAHKINWTKEHYRGGELLQEQRCGTICAI
jgi:hypothetical protein